MISCHHSEKGDLFKIYLYLLLFFLAFKQIRASNNNDLNKYRNFDLSYSYLVMILPANLLKKFNILSGVSLCP